MTVSLGGMVQEVPPSHCSVPSEPWDGPFGLRRHGTVLLGADGGAISEVSKLGVAV